MTQSGEEDVRQAERQTKALESIDTTLKWLFGLVLLFAAAWLIVVVNHV